MRKYKFLNTLYIFMILVSMNACSEDPSSNDSDDVSVKISERYITHYSAGKSYFYKSSPILYGEHIYIGTSTKGNVVTDTNYIAKLTSDLDLVWSYDLNYSEMRGSLAPDSEGNMYGVTRDKDDKPTLISLTNDGVLRWNYKFFSGDSNMASPAVDTVTDSIYIAINNGLFAFDKNGTKIWEYTDSLSRVSNSPIIDANHNIYFAGLNGDSPAMISLDENGILRWRKNDLSTNIDVVELDSSPAFSYDESKVYIAIIDEVFCLNSDDGSEIWGFVPNDFSSIPNGTFLPKLRATPAIDELGNVYIGSKDNKSSVLYAIKHDGSGLLWSNPINADLYSSPALGDNNTLYIGSEIATIGTWGNVRIHAINMETGDHVWQSALPIEGDITWSSPVLSDSGILYIGNMVGDAAAGTIGGGIYSFQTDSSGLMPLAGSARFRLNNSGTGKR